MLLAYLWQDLYFNDFLLLIGIGVGQTRRDRGFSRGVHQSTTMNVIVGKMVAHWVATTIGMNVAWVRLLKDAAKIKTIHQHMCKPTSDSQKRN